MRLPPGKLDDELSFHVDEQTRLNIAKGMSPEEARRQALASLGAIAAIRDDVRDAHPLAWIADLFADWKYGVRTLRSKPALVATAVISLAVGTAVNASVYRFAMATVFSEPTVREPARLFEFAFEGSSHVSLPELEDLQQANVSGGVAGSCVREFVTSRDGESLRVFAQLVTGNYFEVTGTPVAAGRGILPSDENTVVISHRFWQAYFGGSPATIGGTIELNRDRYQITGILPETFVSTLGMGLVTDVIVSFSRTGPPTGFRDRSSRELTGLVRLKEGQSGPQLREALRAMGVEFAKLLPAGERGSGSIRYFQSYADRVRSRGFNDEQTFAAALFVLVTVVLLIACANVAGVLLANGLERRHEIAIRLSIGARRGRIVRQLLAETTLISGAGLVLGWLASRWLTLLSKRIGDLPGIPAEIRLLSPQFGVDGTTIAYLAAILILTTLVCGLLPAFQSAGTSLSPVLRGTGPAVSGGGRMRLRQVLAGAQVCAALTLLVLSAVFLQSSRIAASTSPGFEVDHTVLAKPFAQQGGRKVDAVYMGQAEAALRQVPGVQEVSWASLAPLAGEHYSNDLHPPESPETMLSHMINSVGPRYFAALGIPLVEGREFVEADGLSAVPPVIVSETFARRYFSGASPVGRQLIEGSGKDQRRVQVVGVARDTKYLRLGEAPVALYYRCLLQPPDVRRVATMIIRTIPPGNQMAASIQRALEAVDRGMAVKTEPTRDRVIESLLPYRAGAAILTVLGGIGLLLAFGGLYGVIACSVSQRSHEMGIRLALGATARQMLTLIARDSLRILAAGSVLGVILAWGAVSVLRGFLAAGLRPEDPRYLLPVLLLVGLAGSIATLIPTLRTLRRDPMTSLRHE